MVIRPSTQHKISSREDTYQINLRRYFTDASVFSRDAARYSAFFLGKSRNSQPAADSFIIIAQPSGACHPRKAAHDKNGGTGPFHPGEERPFRKSQEENMTIFKRYLYFFFIFFAPFFWRKMWKINGEKRKNSVDNRTFRQKLSTPFLKNSRKSLFSGPFFVDNSVDNVDRWIKRQFSHKIGSPERKKRSEARKDERFPQQEMNRRVKCCIIPTKKRGQSVGKNRPEKVHTFLT